MSERKCCLVLLFTVPQCCCVTFFCKYFLVECLHKFSLGVANRHKSIKSEVLQTTKLTQCTLTAVVFRTAYIIYIIQNTVFIYQYILLYIRNIFFWYYNLFYFCTLLTLNKHQLCYILPHCLKKEGKPELLSVILLDSSFICEQLHIWFGFYLGFYWLGGFFLVVMLVWFFWGAKGGHWGEGEESEVFGFPKLQGGKKKKNHELQIKKQKQVYFTAAYPAIQSM